MKKNALSILVLAALLGLVTACTVPHTQVTGLLITDMQTALGVAQDNPNVQILSYTLQLTNNGSQEVLVDRIEPTMSGELASRVLPENHSVLVGKPIGPNASLVVTGQLRLNAAGLSKMQIESWLPLVTGATIYNQLMLSMSSSK